MRQLIAISLLFQSVTGLAGDLDAVNSSPCLSGHDAPVVEEPSGYDLWGMRPVREYLVHGLDVCADLPEAKALLDGILDAACEP